MRIRLTPGSMGLVGILFDLFGSGRIDPGSWTTPVWVNDVTEDELEAVCELTGEVDPNIIITVEEVFCPGTVLCMATGAF